MRSTDGGGEAHRGRPHYPGRVTSRFSFLQLAIVTAVFACATGETRAVTEPPPEPVHLGLYEWMATAPIVIAADVVADDGKFVQAVARAVIKGDLAVNALLLIDQRQANRDREEGVPALDLMKGRGYLLLLKASTRKKSAPTPLFDLVRGTGGAKALPPEGSAAVIAAASRMAEVQERHSDEFLWTSLPDFLQDENPVLVDAALDLYVKFRRERVALAPIVQPLLEHPRPDFRRRAALLLGRVLVRADAADVADRPRLVAELTGRARRDDDVTVRREATSALAALPDAGIDETLRVIARDDPDQDVRFEAEKSIFERSQTAAPKRSD
jgi:HEAT repeat protein